MYQVFVDGISNTPPIQTHESDLMEASLKYDDQAVWKRIPNTLTSPTSYFQKIDSDSSAWGKAVATIDASHTQVFSYLWNQDSYEHVHRNAEREGPDALNKVVFVPDSHSMLNVFVVDFGMALSKRVFSMWLVWRQEPDNSFTIAFAPLKEAPLRTTLAEVGRRDATVTHHQQAKLHWEQLKTKKEKRGAANDPQVLLRDMNEEQGLLDAFQKSSDEEVRRRETQSAKNEVSAAQVAAPPFVLP